MRNIKLTLEYDGTDFVGWQVQPNGRSVQRVIEQVLSQLLQEEVKTNAAGRTDAGVHARGQVANFRTETERDLGELQRGMNALLPADVVVVGVEEVPLEFHARYSAKARTYAYQIIRRPTSIARNYTWHVGYRMDPTLLTACSDMIVGEHDFTSFSKNGVSVDHRRCNVGKAQWIEREGLTIFEITANRFLYGMVRALVGTMIDVARGYRPLDDWPKIMEARDRSEAGMSAPAKGLFLDSVTY